MLSFLLVKDDYYDSFFFCLKKELFLQFCVFFSHLFFASWLKGSFLKSRCLPTPPPPPPTPKKKKKKEKEKWGFKALGYECNEEGEVTFVFARLAENFILIRGNTRLLGHQLLLKTRLTNM